MKEARVYARGRSSISTLHRESGIIRGEQGIEEREREREVGDRSTCRAIRIHSVNSAGWFGSFARVRPLSKRDQIIVIPTIIEHSLLINWTKLPTLRRAAEIRTNCGLRQPPITPLFSPFPLPSSFIGAFTFTIGNERKIKFFDQPKSIRSIEFRSTTIRRLPTRVCRVFSCLLPSPIIMYYWGD